MPRAITTWTERGMPDSQECRAVLGHDLVQLLIDGLQHESLSAYDSTELDALIAMLQNADLVVLHFGLQPSCSLATRDAHA